MILESFIRSNFNKAVEIQKSFSHDEDIVNSVKYKTLSRNLVKNWMRSYGLFQGITNEVRNEISDSFVEYVNIERGKDYKFDLKQEFQELHRRFCEIKNRKWLSASSKLLWCINPNEIIIYDAFVHRAITILQCLDVELSEYPRVNNPPDVKKDESSIEMANFYLNYQGLIRTLSFKYKPLIQELKLSGNVEYRYDVRILDKLLWIMGNFKSSFILDEIDCEP